MHAIVDIFEILSMFVIALKLLNNHLFNNLAPKHFFKLDYLKTYSQITYSYLKH